MLDRMRVLLLTASVLAAAGPSVAQSSSGAAAANPFDAPLAKQTMHLSVEPTVTPLSVGPGGKVTLNFAITPKKGMHVYAPGRHQYQVVEVNVAREPWLKVDPTRYPPSEVVHFKLLNERVEVYSKPFRLSRDVTILATPEAKKVLMGMTSVTIAATLEYQACDDSVCYRPTKVPVSVVVQLQ